MEARAGSISVLIALLAGAGAGIGVAGCGVAETPEKIACTTKSDCASNELCELGLCTRQSDSPAKREDAGSHYGRPDSSTRSEAGVTDPTDSGGADGGGGAGDGGTPGDGEVADLGVSPACPSPISVDGVAGYCTITAAIAAANTGSVILVPAGEYAESVDISKELTLRAQGVVVIRGSAGVTPLRLRANGVVVEGFTVQAMATNGIEVAGSSAIRGVTINGAAGIGIAVSLSGTVLTVEQTTINAVAPADPLWGEGIEVNAGTTVTVTGSQITDPAYIGILNLGGTLTVGTTRIDRAGRAQCGGDPERCGYGIVIDTSNTTLQDQTVIDASGAAGVLVYRGSLTMNGSTITRSGQRGDVWSPGILIDGGDPVSVNNSVISQNQDEGIGCWDPGPDNVDSCSNNTHTGNGVWTTCPGC